MPKEEFYKWVKIAGLVSFIPLLLAVGPLAGYLVGDYLKNKFGLDYLLFICIGIGFITSTSEVIKIIRIVIKTSNKS